MGFRTYTFKVGTRQLAVKMAKDCAERLARELQAPSTCAHYARELHGIIGEKENESTIFSPFSTFALPDPDGYQADFAAYVATLPELLTDENYREPVKAARELLNKHMAVEDKRRTPEAVQQAEAQTAAYEIERNAQTQAWIVEYCAEAEKIKIPAGMMAVTLAAMYNNSDSMTDYYDPHHPVSNSVDMLLAIVPKSARTERIAREAVACYDELKDLEFSWHTENYSMGHGNYLDGPYVGKVEAEKAYDGREGVNFRWEVEFDDYSKEFHPFRGYPGNKGAVLATTTRSGATVRRNPEKDGIEVVFSGKPVSTVISALKAAGFFWSQRQGLWYTRFTESKWTFAQSLVA